MGPARCPRAHWQRAKLACPQNMQDLSNSLSTEYLRRKILFFLRKREKGKEEEVTKEGEERREKETYPITAVKVTSIVVGQVQARNL